MNEPVVVVVGAGVAGLACARELERRSVPVVVLERAHGVGGRCATRTIAGQPVDLGTPLLHSSSREFGLELNALPADGKVLGWPVRLREPRLASLPDAFRPGHRRMARREGVNEFARHLADSLDVRAACPVVKLVSDGATIGAIAEDGRRFAAPFLVLATEPTEALALVRPLVAAWPSAAEALARLAALQVVRTLTVVAGYPLATPDPGFDLWHPLEATMVHTLIHDSGKRAAPSHRVLVVHGRAAFSEQHWDEPDEQWVERLIWETAELVGGWAATPEWSHAHRWPCARLRRGASLGDLVTFESPAGACVSLCGDAFAATDGLEGAYLSGVALAEQIATLPRVHERRRASGLG